MLSQDFIINRDGTLHGEGPVAKLLAGVKADPGLLRPYFGEDGHAYVTINSGRRKRVNYKDKRTGVDRVRYEPEYVEVRVKDLADSGVQLPTITTNATTLRKEEWIEYDNATIPPQRERLRLYNDVARFAGTKTFSGLGIKMLEHETVSDPGRAYMDFDGRSGETDDTPLFQLEGQPVPVFHAHFSLDLRTLESSRRSGMPLSTRGVEWATRRTMELVDTVAMGIGTAVEFGTATQVSGYGRTPGMYGLINFPTRLTKTDLTVPTGANPNATIDDILEMRQQLYNAKHYGPYGIYHSTDWDTYLDNDYAFVNGTNWATNPNMTLRQRILAIGTEGGEGNGADEQKQIRFVKRLDRLTPSNSHAFTLIMVSLNQNVIRANNGMPVTLFQYETRGGWEMHFMVACIMFVEMFADYSGNCGILHARTA